TPDGKRLVALEFNTHQPQLWDAASGWKLPGPRGGGGPVAYSPDGRWPAAACHDRIRGWGAATGRPLRTIPCGLGVRALALWAQGRLASVTQDDVEARSAVSVWDAASGEQLFSFKGHAVFVLGLAFRPDGQQLAVVSRGRDPSEGQLNVWNA